jgi:hypothetical protein
VVSANVDALVAEIADARVPVAVVGDVDLELGRLRPGAERARVVLWQRAVALGEAVVEEADVACIDAAFERLEPVALLPAAPV